MKARKLIHLLPLVLALVFSSSPVQAAEGELDEAADQYNRNKSKDKYKVVCRKEAPIGSRIKRKVCRTVASTRNSQREIQRTLNRMRTSVGNQD